ncbi:MAG: ABC transporter permease [Proteobacteria bacterium]|jgi:microcin C transport system permease protein|nr:ABC transporter permease [Pseudomonadota bacterium]MBT6349456.1 ABC transporter permease [Pseudomonadota bacterium]
MSLSPLMQRRWKNFKANKRGYRSLWIVSTMIFLSLFAELLANDKPLVLGYNGSLYFPVLASHPETTFGGIFETEAEYTALDVREMIEAGDGWMVWPPIPFDYETIDLRTEGAVPEAPSMRHLLGTDDIGRDVAARIIYGFRLSILFGLALTFLSSIIGVFVGAVQGYFGGYVDLFGQRVVEIWAGLPVLFLLIILSSLIRPNPITLLMLLLMFSWMALVAVVRAEVLRTRNFDYVRAARAMGESHFNILTTHVLPNAMVATLTFLPFVLNGSITTLTSLDFLGFGLPAGSASLGELLAQGKANLHAPWLGLAGFFTLATLLTLLIFVGEGVRDAFDPRRALS